MASDRTPPVALDETALLVDAIETIVKSALTPVVSRLRAAETAAVDVDILQARVAALESREPVAGPPGPAGADGLGLADFDVTYDGERRVTHVWTRDGRTVTRELVLPSMLYRGVYVIGKAYERGDCVTWAGSLWHANTETTSRPGENAAAWTLAVKRGRDASAR